MKISEFAEGHWPKIIGALIGEEFTNTRKHLPCPNGQGEDRYRFSDKHGNGNYFCACSEGNKDGFALIQCVKGCDFKTAKQMVESVIGRCPRDGNEKRAETYAERLRKQAVKVERSKYLEGRGLETPTSLDWHQQVEYRDEEGRVTVRYPAMLAPIMKGDRFLTYQATYLQGGKKAPVPIPRKTLPGASISGGAVPLYRPMPEMGVAEGVETSIAAKMMHGVPVWACLSAVGLASWEPPDIARHVMIFADNDENFAGHAAAYKLASRLHGKGIKVEVVFPEMPGTDWNDVYLGVKK